MIGLILVAALSAFAGYEFGSSGVPPCKPNPLVETECVDPIPPSDKSFGATTYSLVQTVGQLKKCKAACAPKKE